MTYEVAVRMTLRSASDANRVTKQMESVFEFGTVREAVVDGLALDEEPHLVEVLVHRLARKNKARSCTRLREFATERRPS